MDDDPDVRRLVGDFLRREGFAVDAAEDAAALDAALACRQADLIILDIMLPGEDGVSICRRLRARSGVPILMLSARSDEIDRVIGLEVGADDYLTKPFGPRELLARVRALLRRANSPLSQTMAPSRRFSFEHFLMDLDTRHVADGETGVLALTSGEFDLLACFVQRPRRVLSRDQILDFTRGRGHDPFDRTVDMLVSRLRRKLDTARPGTNLISTVRGDGYLFTAVVRSAP